MSSYAVVVQLDDKSKLSFDEFWIKYINDLDGDDDISYKDEKAKKVAKNLFDDLLKTKIIISDEGMIMRGIIYTLTDYIAKYGKIISEKSIGGWEPILVVI